MSWAAGRETTRFEDMAYCLFGIFDINMPLMYGEEGQAFPRLQEEILKYTTDLSIFAWTRSDERKNQRGPGRGYCGVLAERPRDFLTCSAFSQLSNIAALAFSIYHNGIRLETRLLSKPIPETRGSRYILHSPGSGIQ